jgi:hypothetical protein
MWVANQQYLPSRESHSSRYDREMPQNFNVAIGHGEMDYGIPVSFLSA